MQARDARSVKTDDFPGPVAAHYRSYMMSTEVGSVISAGQSPASTCIVSLDTLPINGLKLMQGAPPLGPVISLSAEGIKLNIGGPLGARIELTPTGLTLAFGPEGAGASIALTGSGITLKMGPANQLELSPTGVNLEALQLALQAATAMKVQAVELTETVAGPVSRTGGVTTMT